MSNGGASPRLSIVQGTCVGISEGQTDVVAMLDDGRCHVGDIVVLATGHDTRSSSPSHLDPWVSPSSVGIVSDDAVLILGTGLTMVDYVLSLLGDGHRGRSLPCRDAACWQKPIVVQTRCAPKKRRFRSASASANSCTGFVAVSSLMSPKAATGAVSSMASGRTRSGSGASFRLPPSAASSNMHAPGGTCIATAWRPRWRRGLHTLSMPAI
jgi:hypothetical protein